MNALIHCRRNASRSSGDAALGALVGGNAAEKRSSNVAGPPGRGIEFGETNGTAGAPKSNTVAPGVSAMRAPRRRTGVLSSVVPGAAGRSDGGDDVGARGTNRPPLPNGPDELEPIGEGSKRL